VLVKDKLPNEICKAVLNRTFDKKMDGKWALGFTKVFLKEEARSVLEQKLGDALKA
jgi:hypothetical protein